jgi:hypothetical protein
MIRIAFAIAAVTLAVTAVAGTSQAAPIAPLPAAVQANNAGVTPVYYYYHRHYHYWHHHCWIGPHGYRHCR